MTITKEKASKPEVAGEPGTSVTIHFPCAGCDNDLYLQPLDANCPECGRAIREGLPAGEKLSFHNRSPDELRRALRDYAVKITVMMVSMSGIAIAITASRVQLNALFMFKSAGLISTLITFAIFAIAHTRRNLAQWRLVVGPDELLRQVPGSRDIRLRREEVSGLAERLDVGLVLHGMTREHKIEIPTGIAGYAGLRLYLQTWGPSRPYISDWHEVRGAMGRFVLLFTGLTMTYSSIRPIAAMGALLFLIAVIGMARAHRRSHASPKRIIQFAYLFIVGGLAWRFYVVVQLLLG